MSHFWLKDLDFIQTWHHVCILQHVGNDSQGMQIFVDGVAGNISKAIFLKKNMTKMKLTTFFLDSHLQDL